jgi:NAD(P)-dependent dehydrogenase (short-subunit alcohol dehydrogenase family)
VSGPRTALVAGAGRGIGRAAVEAFADAGWRAVAGVRDVPAARATFGDRDRVLVTGLDVTDPAAVAEAVGAAEAAAGGALDCVVCNAAYAVVGAVEDVDLGAAREMFETNLFGAIAVIQAALPAMREAGRGVVICTSSVGAWLANPLLGMYHASKYGLAAAAEALAIEARPFGIRVAMVEPGMVDTDFPRATRLTGAMANGEGPYAPLLEGVRAGFADWRRRHPTQPEDVAAAIVRAATDPATPFRVTVGHDAEWLAATRRAAPDDRAWQEELGAFLRLDWRRRPG